MTLQNHRLEERGAVNGQLVAIIGLLVIIVILSGVSAWLYVQYDEQKTKVDNKISLAVAAAKKEQADSDEVEFEKREKEPNLEFAGPDDLGHVSFMYPKTWSVYVDSESSSGSPAYEAYLNPRVVPSVNDQSAQFALRVTIQNLAFDKALEKYRALIKKGDLSSSPISVNGHDGTRLDGSFTKNIRGAAVMFKIRDKTLTVQTDADTFKPDFENIIKTIKYND
jgi:hypothetical protein